MSTIDEQYLEHELHGLQHIVAYIAHLITGLAIGPISGGILLAQIGVFLAGLLSITIVLPEIFAIGGVPLLLGFVLGYMNLKLYQAIRKSEVWAFSTSLYLNLLLLLVLLFMGPIGTTLFVLPIVSLITLFLPANRRYWFPMFREDMGPRMKEIKYSLHLLRKSPLVVGGIVIIVAFVALAAFTPFFAPYGAEERVWTDANLPPGSPSSVQGNPVHIWGTDDSGGDIFSRIFWAAQTDIRISVSVVLVALIIGTLIGAVSGYYGGKIDELVMRITDVFFAFPGLVLAMAIVMALGEHSLDNIALALMVTWWPVYARLVRGQVLAEREKLYVEAARSVGASNSRILLVHIIPNTIQPIIVQATMDTGGVLLTAAGLSFIGFGPSAGVAEWGLMISIGQLYYDIAPWAVFFPGMAILLVALAFNLVGDGIRDIMDPKLRRR